MLSTEYLYLNLVEHNCILAESILNLSQFMDNISDVVLIFVV